ncbi:hypothetical protein ACH4UM_23870 [Streptomyces sp. NPDC020801]|uniref:hypothetical protein n=1 Tax=Streptomyces sp. NPDC020801 TaxID=3365093 RepID=UPI003787FEFD
MPYRSDDLTRLVQDQHTGEVIRLEDQIGADILGYTGLAFDDLIRRTLAAWTQAYGGPNQPATPGEVLRRIIAAARAAIRELLGDLAGRAGFLGDALGEAVALGVQQGIAFVEAASGSLLARTPRVPRPGRELRAEARRIGRLVKDHRDRALRLLRSGVVSRWEHMLTGLGAAKAAVQAVRAHIAWVVNTAVAQGLDEVARSPAEVRLWVSEADACVNCLAYTGRTALIGGSFPGGLSWDPRQRRRLSDVDGPPLHPNCRCRTVPWNDAWVAEGVPFPQALQQEAHRSIAYGIGRPSESRAARLRAARQLLFTERNLLPAVRARAQTAVRTGRFTQAA